MTRSTAALRLALAFATATSPFALATSVEAQEPTVRTESEQDDALYTVEELDNLLAPVALYPDPILAQLLVAATYPEQVQLAARYVATYGTSGIDDQAWDISVKSIARYEPVLNMLAERPNWATALGRAYAMQPGDVMASVQSLRTMARAQGNLVTTSEQRVEVEREAIRIVPAQPTVIYVPVYDPEVIYYRPVDYFHVRTPYWSFGIGYPIGGWLAYDLDWSTRVVYYHGWNGYGRPRTWYHVSRPYISVSGIYISPRRSVIVINRNIVHRRVEYVGFSRYNTVHRRTSWDRRDLPGRDYPGRGQGGQYAKPGTPDRYGIPARRDVGVYKPDKRDDARGTVPRVGGNAPRGDNGSARPPVGGRDERPNVPGNRPGGNGGNGGDRVIPVRAGGTQRPLYPPSEDISPDRVRGRSTDRGAAAGSGNGTWNARPTADRAEPSYKPSRVDQGGAPRTTPREVPRNATRSAPSYEPRYEPRATPRAEPRSQPRVDRNSERSAPRVSVPRSSEPRASVPRSSEPRSAPRASAPRASEPRQSAPRASAPRGERSAPSASRAPSRPAKQRGN